MIDRICIACGQSADFRPTFAGLDRCRGCGFVTYRGNDFAAESLYDAHYFKGGEYPNYVGQERALRRSMRRHLDQMARHGGERGSLLEVGCAYGFFLDEAKRSFDPVVGIDIARAAVDHARSLGIDARCGDFLEADLSKVDVVCLWDTIEHLERPDEYLAKARALMHSGGRLFLTTGDLGSLNARIRGASWRQIHPPTHLHYFDRTTVRALLSRTGFDVVAIETAAYYHTLYNVLGSLSLRQGALGRISGVASDLLGEELGSKLGLWIDLRDIMFVAARAV